MKRIALALVCLMPCTAMAQSTPINLEYAQAYFDELRELGRADGGKLWKHEVAGPMLFADRATRSVVANQPDTQGLLRQQNGVWVGTLPPEQMVANTSISWAGRDWSMVMWPVPDNRYARARLLMHESFHRIQRELGLPSEDRANAHLGSGEARIWTRLEWRALTEALLRTGGQRKEALRDALTFRAHRRSLYQDATEDERRLELNEGLAEYTGFVLSGLPRSALYDRLAVQLAQYEQQENYARSFAYASGPAYGLLLDDADAGWRSRLTAASELSAMAAQAYGIGDVDPQVATARVSIYAGDRMVAEERAREASRVATEARLRARFIEGPVLSFPVKDRFNYSFDPNGATPLANVGTVFQSSRITDEWGVLEVASGGVLLKRGNAGITAAVVAVTPTDTAPMKGEGWTLQLSPGWTIVAGPRKGDWLVQPENRAK